MSSPRTTRRWNAITITCVECTARRTTVRAFDWPLTPRDHERAWTGAHHRDRGCVGEPTPERRARGRERLVHSHGVEQGPQLGHG